MVFQNSCFAPSPWWLVVNAVSRNRSLPVKGHSFQSVSFPKNQNKCFLSEIATPINRHVINIGVSFGYSCDCGSIQFLLASFERPTCIATETSTHPDMFPCQLLQIPDPMTGSLEDARLFHLKIWHASQAVRRAQCCRAALLLRRMSEFEAIK